MIIEINLTPISTELYYNMKHVMEILSWLMSTIDKICDYSEAMIKDEYLESIKNLVDFNIFKVDYDSGKFLQGFMMIYDKDHNRLNSCIICEHDKLAREILKVLQQPPEPYNGKYVACVVSEEPPGVIKIDDDTSIEKKDEISIKIEET